MSDPKAPNYELMFPLKNRKANIYWPIYENLEKEFGLLSFNIFIDDAQLNTYSYKIAELILRAAIEIETISKDLYLREGGENKKNLNYDDALKYLNSRWNLERKILKVSSSNVHITDTTLIPFSKITNERNGKLHYMWNIAYQNIKHDRGRFIRDASIVNLLNILGALYILNLYFNEEEFNLENDSGGQSLYSILHTELFAVSIHRNQGLNFYKKQNKRDGYEESLYYVIFDDTSRDKLVDGLQIWMNKLKELLPKGDEFDKFRKMENITELLGNKELEIKLGKETLNQYISYSSVGIVETMKNLTNIARINKNDL